MDLTRLKPASFTKIALKSAENEPKAPNPDYLIANKQNTQQEQNNQAKTDYYYTAVKVLLAWGYNIDQKSYLRQ